MGKILVTGAGRSGTTFLMQLLTRLGFDTGFEPYNEPYKTEWRAGCEWSIDVDWSQDPPAVIKKALEDSPRVQKSCEWGLVLKYMLSQKQIEVDHVIVPFRDFDEAAISRVEAGLQWGIDETLTGDEAYSKQANVNAIAFGRAIEACVLYSIPCTIITFPLFIDDADYCFRKMSEIQHIERKKFNAEFIKLSNPKQVKWRNYGRDA